MNTSFYNSRSGTSTPSRSFILRLPVSVPSPLGHNNNLRSNAIDSGNQKYSNPDSKAYPHTPSQLGGLVTILGAKLSDCYKQSEDQTFALQHKASVSSMIQSLIRSNVQLLDEKDMRNILAAMGCIEISPSLYQVTPSREQSMGLSRNGATLPSPSKLTNNKDITEYSQDLADDAISQCTAVPLVISLTRTPPADHSPCRSGTVTSLTGLHHVHGVDSNSSEGNQIAVRDASVPEHVDDVYSVKHKINHIKIIILRFIFCNLCSTLRQE